MPESERIEKRRQPTPRGPASDDLRSLLSGAIARRSLLVALVVGTILNAINQGDALLAGEPLSVWKLGLTYTVPFFVSSYGAWTARRLLRRAA